MQVRTLSTLECTKLLTANRVGHLACAKDGQPYIVPFYYAHALKPAASSDVEHLPHVFFRISITEVSGREASES